jgi:hypothetical protein
VLKKKALLHLNHIFLLYPPLQMPKAFISLIVRNAHPELPGVASLCQTTD